MRIKYFNRYELKYVLKRGQYEHLVDELAKYMDPDPYGDQGGRYLVTSLYYDTANYKAYWDKIQGHRFRRKVRIRVYDAMMVSADTLCFVEIKQRTSKTIQKKRVVLPYSLATALCSSGRDIDGGSGTDQTVISEIQYLYNTLRLQPACIVSYDRLAFNGSEYDPGLRVTFDTNLKCRAHDLTLLSQGSAENHYFLPPHWCVMEIKVNDRVPYWLTEVISEHRCTLRRISKYCVALEQATELFRSRRIVY
jgi:hypothetical protein